MPPGNVCLRSPTPMPRLLMLAFGPGGWRSVVGGVSQAEVETAFPGWAMLAVEGADTAGLELADAHDRADVVPAAPIETDLAQIRS